MPDIRSIPELAAAAPVDVEALVQQDAMAEAVRRMCFYVMRLGIGKSDDPHLRRWVANPTLKAYMFSAESNDSIRNAYREVQAWRQKEPA